jgi:hypothetical protein
MGYKILLKVYMIPTFFNSTLTKLKNLYYTVPQRGDQDKSR